MTENNSNNNSNNNNPQQPNQQNDKTAKPFVRDDKREAEKANNASLQKPGEAESADEA